MFIEEVDLVVHHGPDGASDKQGEDGRERGKRREKMGVIVVRRPKREKEGNIAYQISFLET